VASFQAGHENPFPVNAPQPFQLYMMDTDRNNPWPSPGIQDGADYNGKVRPSHTHIHTGRRLIHPQLRDRDSQPPVPIGKNYF
jgi:hypothetical protein